MGETTLNVKLLAHTQLSAGFFNILAEADEDLVTHTLVDKDSQAVALTAIRTCYSANKPTEIIVKEGSRYFGREASDGEGGSEADRLIRHIMRSRHLSTLEHLNYTFAIEGLSRAALAQLTRHRHMSFSVQSQRYVKFGSGDRSGGFDYVMPPIVREEIEDAEAEYDYLMRIIQETYDRLRGMGVPAEDARAVLPNAAATNLVMTANLRTILEFYSKRKPGRGAQIEIATLAEKIREEVVAVDPWVSQFFEEV
ncbi:FAD-dependent thymidylate synthase [Thermoactinomyces daqus]|uniref:FAD-dependent thymidylate synthase n=1 Tax=Thermoactinomyces daqus TaxID=1329516 RepID=A0A7W1X8P1_9BACL|nr:FAD-dependent thymidylate synthase [Thermoactinomyces daqus]MBA4542044.1 FAD-dependent thymidylate synthase [Thermoactinomyces daqus]